jgi:hypothetical protein
MATGRLLRSGPTNNRPWIRPHEMNDAAACLTTVVQYIEFIEGFYTCQATGSLTR